LEEKQSLHENSLPETKLEIALNLKHLHNEKPRFYCPQAFLSFDFQCMDDVSELK